MGATLGRAAVGFPAIHGGAAGLGRPEGGKLDRYRKQMWWFVLERTFSSPGLKAGSTFSQEQPLPTCASPASFEMQPLLGWAAVITLKHIVLPPLLAGRKEEYCAPSPDKIEINNWDFSQRADLSSLPLNLSWMGALYPFCFPGASVSFCSSEPVFMGRFKAADSSQEFFLALCFPSAVCFPLHTTDADGSPSVVSKETCCTLCGAGKLPCPQERSSRETFPLLNQHRSGIVSHRQWLVHMTPISGTANQLALELWLDHLRPFTAVYLPLCCKTPDFRLLPLAHLCFHIPEYTGGALFSPQGMFFSVKAWCSLFI